MSTAPEPIAAGLSAPKETPEERLNRRMATALLLRRRRREAGLTFRHVSLATSIDPSRLSRYEQAWQYPGPAMVEYVLAAIARLAAEGAGNPTKAVRARRTASHLRSKLVGVGGSPIDPDWSSMM